MVLTNKTSTILFYPFTPFFVLFCNVIGTRDYQDFRAMQGFVEYLAEVKDIVGLPFILDMFLAIVEPVSTTRYFYLTQRFQSPSVAKLHKLCIPFCALASSILIQGGESDLQRLNGDQTELSGLGSEIPQQLIYDHQVHSYLPSRSQPELPTSYPAPNPPGFMGSGSSAMHMNIPDTHIDMGFENADFMWDFVSTQPTLQWMDSDFSSLGEAWGLQPGSGYPF
jgi:hypothetical protein